VEAIRASHGEETITEVTLATRLLASRPPFRGTYSLPPGRGGGKNVPHQRPAAVAPFGMRPLNRHAIAAGLGLTSALLLGLGAAAPAMASSGGGGAQHTTTTTCSPDGSYCEVATDRYHLVRTPSGNTNESEKLSEASTDGGFLSTQKGHTLAKDGTVQESTYAAAVTLTIPDLSCASASRTTYANGKVRSSRTASTAAESCS
jgi:hypothetical protein